MPQVSEDLNPEGWTTQQQQSVYDELAVLLDIPQGGGCDYTTMSDAELSTQLNTLCLEIASRPAATTANYVYTTLGADTIVIPEGGE